MGRVSDDDGMKLLLVCLGGAAGAGCRYLLAGWLAARVETAFPVGTLVVNLLGSLLLGALMQATMLSESPTAELRALVATGLLGGFTTYSAFNYEATALLQKGATSMALSYVAATLLGCLLAGAVGMAAVRMVG